MTERGNDEKRKYLLVSTLTQRDGLEKVVENELTGVVEHVAMISVEGMKINHCVGCNDCWIKTPGLCRLQDDYEQILIKMLQADCVIFLTEAKLGFVCSQMKNMIDRILPLATMHLRFRNGQMRHDSRYGKMPDLALIYKGQGDREYLNLWLDRVQLNLCGKSLGAYEAVGRKELYHALAHH